MTRHALALSALLLVAAAPDSGRSPETNYKLHCQGCHRPDGSGIPGTIPDLRGQVAIFLGSPAGRAFLVQVPGSANSPLSDRDLADLLVFIVYRFDPEHVPENFANYTAAEVADLRSRGLTKVKETRAAILAELNATGRAASPPPESAPPGAAGAPARRSN